MQNKPRIGEEIEWLELLGRPRRVWSTNSSNIGVRGRDSSLLDDVELRNDGKKGIKKCALRKLTFK